MRTHEYILENIEMYQNSGIFHPLTCGNNSRHKLLKGEVRDGEVILVCEDCDYLQDNFAIPSKEDLEEILNNSPLHKFLLKCTKK